MDVDVLNEVETAASEYGLDLCLRSPGTHGTGECVGLSFGSHVVEKKKNLLLLPDIKLRFCV